MPQVAQVNFTFSPYARTVETLNDILAHKKDNHQIAVSCHMEPLIKEKALGAYEGFDLSNLPDRFGAIGQKFVAAFHDPETKYGARPPSRKMGQDADHDHPGESYKDCNKRIIQFLKNGPFSPDETIVDVVIGHGRTNTFIEKEILGISEKNYFSIPIPHNGALKHFIYNAKTKLYESQGFIFEGFSSKIEKVMEKKSVPFSQ